MADLLIELWNLLVIEHIKPYLARALWLIAIINDRQSLDSPMDYPKFDTNAKLTII
jgi:hypothetical protein